MGSNTNAAAPYQQQYPTGTSVYAPGYNGMPYQGLPNGTGMQPYYGPGNAYTQGALAQQTTQSAGAANPAPPTPTSNPTPPASPAIPNQLGQPLNNTQSYSAFGGVLGGNGSFAGHRGPALSNLYGGTGGNSPGVQVGPNAAPGYGYWSNGYINPQGQMISADQYAAANPNVPVWTSTWNDPSNQLAGTYWAPSNAAAQTTPFNVVYNNGPWMGG